jgi:uncharacterized membrane protein
MRQANEAWDDRRLDRLIGGILRGGVLLSAAVVLVGAIIYLIRHGAALPAYHIFRGEPSDLRSVSGIIARSLSGHGRGFIQLGILLLIATPVARVAFSVLGFALERDRKYVVLTLIVLGVLLYSLAGAKL